MKDICITKPFNGKDVLEAGACKDDFEKFVRRFGFYEEIHLSDLLESDVPTSWLSWLKKKGFIRDSKNAEIVYKVELSEDDKTITIGTLAPEFQIIARIEMEQDGLHIHRAINYIKNEDFNAPTEIIGGRVNVRLHERERVFIQ